LGIWIRSVQPVRKVERAGVFDGSHFQCPERPHVHGSRLGSKVDVGTSAETMRDGVAPMVERPGAFGMPLHPLLISAARKSAPANPPGRNQTVRPDIEQIPESVNVDFCKFATGTCRIIMGDPLLDEVRDDPVRDVRLPDVCRMKQPPAFLPTRGIPERPRRGCNSHSTHPSRLPGAPDLSPRPFSTNLSRVCAKNRSNNPTFHATSAFIPSKIFGRFTLSI